MKTRKPFPRRGALLVGLALLLLGGAAGCAGDDPQPDEQLPAATRDGRHTLGCLVDGKVWVPHTRQAIEPRIDSYLSGGNAVHIWADREPTVDGNENIALDISGAGPLLPGTYPLGRYCKATYETSSDLLPNGRRNLYTTETPGSSGVFTITNVEPVPSTSPLVRPYTIVSGTFEFTARAANGKAVVVRDGRFDVKSY